MLSQCSVSKPDWITSCQCPEGPAVADPALSREVGGPEISFSLSCSEIREMPVENFFELVKDKFF